MKKAHVIKMVIVGLIASVALVACGEVGELLLDDTWDLQEIETDTSIDPNLDNYITITFDAGDSEAVVDEGTDWPVIFPDPVDAEGTYEYQVEQTDNVINFYQGDALQHVVTYRLEDGYDTMIWTSWVDVSEDPDVTIVGPDETVTSLTFNRE